MHRLDDVLIELDKKFVSVKEQLAQFSTKDGVKEDASDSKSLYTFIFYSIICIYNVIKYTNLFFLDFRW